MWEASADGRLDAIAWSVVLGKTGNDRSWSTGIKWKIGRANTKLGILGKSKMPDDAEM
jgi:hypothetical protein